MKEKIEINVEPRTTGKHFSRGLRVKSKIPAVVYGTGKSANICLEEKVIVKYNARAYENALYTLKSADSAVNNTVVLMKEVSVHPVSQKPLHVDFLAIDVTKKIKVFVEVRLEGKPIGIADGGLLNAVMREVEIECLPTEIPEFISMDVSNLGVGMALHVSDITLPKGVEMVSLGDLTVAVVNKEEEKVVAAPEAAAAATAAAPAAGAAAAPAAGAKPGAAAPAAGAKAAAPKGDKK